MWSRVRLSCLVAHCDASLLDSGARLARIGATLRTVGPRPPSWLARTLKSCSAGPTANRCGGPAELDPAVGVPDRSLGALPSLRDTHPVAGPASSSGTDHVRLPLQAHVRTNYLTMIVPCMWGCTEQTYS